MISIHSFSISIFRRYSSQKGDLKRYLKRQLTDEFAIKAREHNYRARSAFKLLEINDKYKFLKPGSVILDVGCAPGSWSQVVVEKCLLDQADSDGLLIGVDLQPVLPIVGANIFSLSDITEKSTQANIHNILSKRKVDVVLSDMAPNPTGSNAVDHFRLIELCRTVFRLFHPDSSDSSAIFTLSPRGVYLCKIWDGSRRKEFMEELQTRFKFVRPIKPNACRDNSAELYLYCSMK